MTIRLRKQIMEFEYKLIDQLANITTLPKN